MATTHVVLPLRYHSPRAPRETSAQVKAGGSAPARAHSVRCTAGRSEQLFLDRGTKQERIFADGLKLGVFWEYLTVPRIP